MLHKRYLRILIFLFLFFSGISPILPKDQTQVVKLEIDSKAKKLKNIENSTSKVVEKEITKVENHNVTIWVHGTQRFAKYFSWIVGNFFYAIPGLNKAELLEKKYHLRKMAESISSRDPINYPFDKFYFFGWSGELSFTARLNAAKRLYKELKRFIAKYDKKYGEKPKITFITHSHGGNVVLNLVKAKLEDECDLCISKVILLACPVQEKTKNYVKDKIFPEVISYYSTLDILQVIDPQGLYVKSRMRKKRDSFFSERKFEPSSNLKQFQIKINNRGIFHIEFLFKRFTNILPDLVEKSENQNNDDCLFSILLK